jgi:hypothetical protein
VVASENSKRIAFVIHLYYIPEMEEVPKKEQDLVTLRLPTRFLERAEELIPQMQQRAEFSAHRLSRSSVLRIAMLRGLQSLEKDLEKP